MALTRSVHWSARSFLRAGQRARRRRHGAIFLLSVIALFVCGFFLLAAVSL